MVNSRHRSPPQFYIMWSSSYSSLLLEPRISLKETSQVVHPYAKNIIPRWALTWPPTPISDTACARLETAPGYIRRLVTWCRCTPSSVSPSAKPMHTRKPRNKAVLPFLELWEVSWVLPAQKHIIEHNETAWIDDVLATIKYNKQLLFISALQTLCHDFQHQKCTESRML